MLKSRAAAFTGRHELESARDRLRGGAWSVVQCAIAAGVAWQLATALLGHQRPFFACAAAVVCLGVHPARRMRRVAELAVGVTLGVAVGDLLVQWIGTGAWQISLVVAVALLLAVLLGGSTLLTNQAGLQAVFVVALPAMPGGQIGRWQDAMIGGTTALAVAGLLPGDPWREPQRLGQALARKLAAVLRSSATALREHDGPLAVQTLATARSLDRSVGRWDEAVATGRDISRSSPLRRDPANQMWNHYSALALGMDRAIGNLRVLMRRLMSSLDVGEAMPPCLPALLEDLAAIVHLLAADLGDTDGEVVRRLTAYGARLDPGALGATSLSGVVAVAQLRTAVVDLLQGLGVAPEQARTALPALS